MISNSTILAIWQQSEYDWQQLEHWFKAHKDEEIEIQPEKWTLKLQLIAIIAQIFYFLPGLSKFQVALAMILPFEHLLRQLVYSVAKLRLTWFKVKGLTVVAIAGSYGKTSTKQILYHTFAATHSVLITPKSINTRLGIAQVILKELTAKHTLFIVEFGEYHPQDIPQLTRFIQPDYGILTPIGRQHLSIIGGFEQLITSFSKFTKYFEDSSNLLIAEQNIDHFDQVFEQKYGQKKTSSHHIDEVSVSRRGTEFIVHTPTQKHHSVFMPLFGAHQAVNTLPAFWLAEKIDVDPTVISIACATLPFIHRRHEPTFSENNVLVLDNSYNTNPDSAIASLQLLEDLKPERTLVVTMGFTELGEESEKAHREFGELLAKSVDYVSFIDTPNTKIMMEGFISAGGKKSHVMIGKDMDEAVALLGPHIIPNSIILLEGGYRELYS